MEIFADNWLAWALFMAYIVLTSWLAWLGHKKTEGLSSFALGKGDMHPVVMGVTLATAIASVATFVVNPGFVYVHGISALLHLGVAAPLGMFTALLVLSFGFQRVGQSTKALTLPQWIGERYGSQAMTIFFAAVMFLQLTFVVLIVGALSLVMQETLGLGPMVAAAVIIGFVFSYIFIGGTYAHAYTNTLQGIVMTVIAAIIVISGVGLLTEGFDTIAETLAAVDPSLIEHFNVDGELMAQYEPNEPLFGGPFSVWIAGFMIGFALVCQPHVIIKPLYVKDRTALWQGLGVYFVVSVVFLGLLLVGLYAHLAGIGPEMTAGPTGDLEQDRVLILYVVDSFGPVLTAVISVALLAAGMSTLDGILIALSSIFANDFFLNLTRDGMLADNSEEERQHIAHRAGQLILVAMGVVTFIIVAITPPGVLAIFGQIGVYGIVVTGCVPILFGIFFDDIDRRFVFAAAIIGLVVYLGLYIGGGVAIDEGIVLSDMVPSLGILVDTEMELLGLPNPAVPAAYAIIASLLVAIPGAVASVVDGE